jgi:putative oxidoreductase
VNDRDRIELLTFTALRIACGVMLFCHGFVKLFGVFGNTADIGSQMWIGGILELVGGACVAAGFFTRFASFVLAGEMAVAYFQFHWKLHFAGWKFLPLVNGGELAVVYCFALLVIWARGAGMYSLDRRYKRA